MTALAELLGRVAARLSRGWCQDAYARDQHGVSVKPTDPEACSWCLWGAVRVETRRRATDREQFHLYDDAMRHLASVIRLDPGQRRARDLRPAEAVVSDFNDAGPRTAAEVVELVYTAKGVA